MSFTPEFWLILGLTLVLGWVLGLMSRSGGGRWKRELAAEREAHATYRRDAEARIGELERENARYRADLPPRDRPASAIDNLDLRRP
ncbi:hypothetical protein GON01_04230 [Sphingomonas sp. MAH-20]|uniref:Uncharacterized protein n=1 Tax=Sphingomonas horti TaxID=2682842 RepID=A0A6I4IYJ2_9SPHN|nr:MULTISPECIES: hypothetical protein [Sphingomonas]MBA2918177.1 hypothetical protein [Sphingomonas sp. CGMCC 1.13658]MVO77146.1 hypothetical protein [Sphingomonas horti]